jgi:hypothetical protein
LFLDSLLQDPMWELCGLDENLLLEFFDFVGQFKHFVIPVYCIITPNE